MPPLQRLRQRAFDPRFLDRSPLFWPIARAARAVLAASGSGGPNDDFPGVDALAHAFAPQGPPAPVRFVASPPRPRRASRARVPLDPLALYDARITVDRVVPSRERSWHDLMNAFVWGTFPRAKLALHARQHRAISERIAPGARTLPGTRTRELDALALLDEGGVVVPRSGVAGAIVFGHAIYESLALQVPPAIVAAIHLDVDVDVGRQAGPPRTEREAAEALGSIDEALARCVEDRGRLATPLELARVALPAAAPSIRGVAWATHGPAATVPDLPTTNE